MSSSRRMSMLANTSGVHDHLRLTATVSALADPERMRGLVDQDPHLRIGRLPGIDDDPPAVLVARPARRARESPLRRHPGTIKAPPKRNTR